MDKKNTCPDCGKAIGRRSARCSSCAARKRRESLAPPTCIDCGTLVSLRGNRCRPCAGIRRRRPDLPKTCIDCGKVIKRVSTRCKSCAIRKRRAPSGPPLPPPTCPGCGASVSKHGSRCRSCAAIRLWQDPAYRRKAEEANRKIWEDDDGSLRAVISRNSTEMWCRPGFRERASAATAKRTNTPGARANRRAVALRCWQDPDYRKQLTGENSYFWRGGDILGSYPPEFNEVLKQKARERDGFICILCGKARNGRALDIHHIDLDKSNNSMNNLVSLHNACHSKVHTADFDTYRVGFEALFANNSTIEATL